VLYWRSATLSGAVAISRAPDCVLSVCIYSPPATIPSSLPAHVIATGFPRFWLVAFRDLPILPELLRIYYLLFVAVFEMPRAPYRPEVSLDHK